MRSRALNVLQSPGENAAWKGEYQIEGVDLDRDRDLHVTVYDSTAKGPVAIGERSSCAILLSGVRSIHMNGIQQSIQPIQLQQDCP